MVACSSILMFGVTKLELDQYITDNVGNDKFFYSHAQLATSILSDAQECLSMGDSEKARQLMNRAKYVLSFQLTKDRQSMKESA